MKKYSLIGYRRHIGGTYSIYCSQDQISLSKALYLIKQWQPNVEKIELVEI